MRARVVVLSVDREATWAVADTQQRHNNFRLYYGKATTKFYRVVYARDQGEGRLRDRPVVVHFSDGTKVSTTLPKLMVDVRPPSMVTSFLLGSRLLYIVGLVRLN